MSWKVAADFRETWTILQNSLWVQQKHLLLVNSLKFRESLFFFFISDFILSGSMLCGTEYDSFLLDGAVYLP